MILIITGISHAIISPGSKIYIEIDVAVSELIRTYLKALYKMFQR